MQKNITLLNNLLLYLISTPSHVLGPGTGWNASTCQVPDLDQLASCRPRFAVISGS